MGRRTRRQRRAHSSPEMDALNDIKGQLNNIESNIDEIKSMAVRQGAISGAVSGGVTGGIIAIGFSLIRSRLGL